MNGPESFRPSIGYARSLSNGACLGACTGSLYLAILVTVIIPVHKLMVFSVALVVATALSVPFLFWLSLILAPLLDGS